MANSNITLPDLVEAFMNAIADAQDKIERQTMDNINEWFDAEGRPKMVAFRVPSLMPQGQGGSEDGAGEQQLKVPLLTLMQNNPIKIKRLVTKFDINLGGVVVQPEANPDKGASSGEAKRMKKLLTANLFANKKRRGQEACMEIEFESGEPTEAYLKLQNELLKLI